MMLVIKSPNLLMVSKLAVDAKDLKRIVAHVFFLLAGLASFHVEAGTYTWSDYKLYKSWAWGADITITEGDIVYYDSTAGDVVGNLTVNGAFYCTDPATYSDLNIIRKLTVSSVMVMGSGALFECGKNNQKFMGKFDLAFQESQAVPLGKTTSCNSDISNFIQYLNSPATYPQYSGGTAGREDCQSFMVMSGGSLQLFGGSLGSDHIAWTKISSTANSLATSINVLNVSGWKSGDSIAIAASTVGNHAVGAGLPGEGLPDPSVVQMRVISSIVGSAINFTEPLSRKVYGDSPYVYGNIRYQNPYQQSVLQKSGVDLKDQNNIPLFSRMVNKSSNGGQVLSLDERAEVVNKSRNIVFTGSDNYGIHLGMQMMFMSGAGPVNIDGLEVIKGGRAGELARYPVHWHKAGNRDGDFIRNSSIHDGFNRCVTIHGTNNVSIENNVCVNVMGHAFFLEDGDEIGNVFIDNVAMLVNPHIKNSVQNEQWDRMLLYSDRNNESSDTRFSSSAGFWISNPNNIFIGNSASSVGTGYWYALKDDDHKVDRMTNPNVLAPNRAPMGVFSGNAAHTTNIGYSMDGGPNGPCADNPRNPCVTTDGGINRTGDHQTDRLANQGYFPLQNQQVLVDDFTSYKATGFALWLLSGKGGVVTNSVFADSGTNVALVFSDDLTNSVIVGKSPALESVDAQAFVSTFSKNPSSFALYDGPSKIERVHFAGYSDSIFTAVPFSMTQAASARTAAHLSKNISFEEPNAPRADMLHDQGNEAKDNYAGGFYDADGSVSGISDSTIVPNESIMTTSSCSSDPKIKNAQICPGRYGLFRLSNAFFPLYDLTRLSVLSGSNVTYILPSPRDTTINANQFSFPLNHTGDYIYKMDFLSEWFDDVVRFPAGDRFFSPEFHFMNQGQWSPWIILHAKDAGGRLCDIQSSDKSRLGVDIEYILDSASPYDLHFRLKATLPESDSLPYGYSASPDRVFYYNKVGVYCGTDIDADGVTNNADAFPLNVAEATDTDNDGVGNNADADDDNDTVLDASDNCVLVANTNQLNAEGDALGDACDTDDDNDLVEDGSDADGFTKFLTPAADTYSPISSGDVLSFFTVTGLALDDTITTLGGNDWIDGGTGNDSMTGGAGNDTYIVNSTSDSITEAATVGEIDGVQSSATFALPINVENLSLTGSSAINATGNASDNTLIGNTGNNTFSCLVGVDTISYASATSAVVFTLASTANQIVTGFGTDKLLSAADCENLITGSGNDTLNGNGSANTLTGNEGNDSLIGGAGVDAMIGGQGNDTYTVDNVNDVVTELASEGTDLVNSSVTYTILDVDVESLTLTGSTNINATGNASNNLLTGNTGTNTLTGGAGDDTYVVQAADGVVENASEGTDLVQSAVAYTITDTDVENLTLTGGGSVNATGNASANTLVGNTGANTLIGKQGSDTLTGGAGIDKFVMDDVLTPSIVTDFVKGTDKVVVDISDVGAGDADAVVEGGLSRAASGGFSGAMAANELVIFTTNIVGTVDTTSAATAIGSASTTMTAGVKKIFVVDNGTNSYVYRFTSAANDVTVTAAELVLLATLTNVNDSGTGDYLFQL